MYWRTYKLKFLKELVLRNTLFTPSIEKCQFSSLNDTEIACIYYFVPFSDNPIINWIEKQTRGCLVFILWLYLERNESFNNVRNTSVISRKIYVCDLYTRICPVCRYFPFIHYCFVSIIVKFVKYNDVKYDEPYI